MKTRLSIRAALAVASVGSGCLDVLCYRFLGEVLPSAMTGNLALLGRSIGAGDLGAAQRNALAFAMFFAGAFVGAALLRGNLNRWRRLGPLALQAVMLLGFALLWDRAATDGLRLLLIAVAALGMGLQSATANRIGLHAVSTTYFTGTTANIAFGLAAPAPGMPAWERFGWPVLAVLGYLLGAALAGWSALAAPPIAASLPWLPLATMLVLALAVVTTRPPPADGTPPN